MPPHLTVTAQPEPDQAQQVFALLTDAEAQDGTPPVNEAGRLTLRHPRPEVRHLLMSEGDALQGYAQIADGSVSGSDGAAAQLVVRPAHRGRGLGTSLLRSVLQLSPGRLHIWAMGNSEAAQRLATHAGLLVERELLVMTRSLLDPLPDTPVVDGVRIRPFSPGQDEGEWLALNADAFADHPEQGAMTRADLDERMVEEWFDPAGFLLAETEGRMVGFHWTKQHPGHLGEVYVLGVSPAAGRQGLGRALLEAGLAHLRRRGNTEVQLYVEADHPRAVGLYRAYGFATVSRDVMYAQR